MPRERDAMDSDPFTGKGERRRHPFAFGVLLKLISVGPLVVLLCLGLCFSLLSPVFLTEDNVTNIFVQSSVVALIALGALPVLLVGSLDLSLGATAALATILGAMTFQESSSLGWAVVPVMIGVGTLAGAVNALLIVGLRIGNSFIVTLGTLYAFASLGYVLAGGSQIAGMPGYVLDLANGNVLGIPGPVLLVAVFSIFLGLLLKGTIWGRWVFAIGGNAGAAERIGIPTKSVLASVFILAGVFAGIAAILTAGRADGGYPSSGNSILLAIAAVVIGGASLSGGRGTVFGTLIGALILGTITNGLGLLAVDPNWVLFAVGSILVAAVGIERLRARVEERLRVRQAQIESGDLA